MNTKPSDLTASALAFREPEDALHAHFRAVADANCRAIADALPNMVMVLNGQRQIVFANQAALAFLGVADQDALLGRRPGEALSCINAQECRGGCGTSRHCRSCGALISILSALADRAVSDECNLLRRVSTGIESLDLRVNAVPIVIEGQRFIVLAITDITYETRYRSMERIFFHDVLNLAGGINGMAEMLQELVPDALKKDMAALQYGAESLVNEVLAQRDIAGAEKNEIKPFLMRIETLEILRRLQSFYSHSPAAAGKSIVVDQASASLEIIADLRLVQRVLGNMLKNALEAEPSGGTVQLSCRDEGDEVVFSVHNHGFIPESVQDSIFRRSFSTKGTGRGLGTYSMLLLTERYLCGNVGFRSTEADGTVFFLRMPKAVLEGQPCPQQPALASQN